VLLIDKEYRTESIELLKDLTLRHGVLEGVTNLSVQVHERFSAISRADKLIKRTIWNIERKRKIEML
jgi:hypothetical protein